MNSESHLSDQDLVRAADGELGVARAAEVARHLEQCWSCRARQRELELAVGDFVQVYRDGMDASLPPPAGPRALLKAQMEAAEPHTRSWWPPLLSRQRVAIGALLLLLLAGSYRYWGRSETPGNSPSEPEPSLTPGAVVRLDRDQVCHTDFPKNRVVPASLQRRVFEEYGISGARPNAYEVDYLITPALGGADDIRNLWPQAYSSAVWNARVKDALEDRLRELVCHGDVELASAQSEIASDWIAAYKKYFHTDQPPSNP